MKVHYGSINMVFQLGLNVNTTEIITDYYVALKLKLVEVENELKEVSVLIDDVFPEGEDLYDLRTSSRYGYDANFRKHLDEHIEILARVDSLTVTRNVILRALKRIQNDMRTEADYGLEEDSKGEIGLEENLMDIMGDSPTTEIMGVSDKDVTMSSVPLELGEFLSRPIPIYQTLFDFDTNYQIKLSPWNLWSLVPSIRAKLRNFAFFKGNLNIRISVSGTPFDYGRLLVAYQPLTVGTPIATSYASYASTALRFNGMKYLSQLPGSTTINVNANKPLELKIPFVCPNPLLRLYNNSAAALGTSSNYNDFAEMGDLHIWTLNQIRNCTNDGSSKVSMYVYAWMTEVELGCTTATLTAITTENDERIVGPVERIASRVAGWATSLAAVPFLKPYATASGAVASGIAQVAALFGWSVPTINTAPIRVKPMGFQNMANVIGYDSGSRITLDPKQELTVDPRCTGSADDDMLIAKICARPSLLGALIWSPAQTPLTTPIWTCIVNPNVGSFYTSVSSELCYQPTALAFASRPFVSWRGSIKYRFEVVVSKFHRGKFAIFYEPNCQQGTLINASLQTNKNYILIVDIQETTDVEVEIKWAHNRAWALVNTDALANASYDNALFPLSFLDYANGYIGITPLTQLQSPDGQSIVINVYVHSTDMRFNELSSAKLPTKKWFPSTAFDYKTEGDDQFESQDGIDTVVLNPVPSSMKGICEDYYGESPITFRNLLKRFFRTDANKSDPITGSSAGNQLVTYLQNIIPAMSPSSGSNLATNVYVPNLLSYLRPAYLGLRGGLKKRISVNGANIPVGSVMRVVFRNPETSVTPSLVSGSVTISQNDIDVHGTTEIIPMVNGGVEFELPFYSIIKFAYSQLTDPFSTASSFMVGNVARGYNVVHMQPADYYSTTSLFVYNGYIYQEETAVGEDFALLRFLAAPPCVI